MYFSKPVKTIFCRLIFFCTLCVTSVASAETVRPFVIAGLAYGGDNLVSTSGQDLDAGNLFYIGGGAIFEPNNSPLVYQFSMGYKTYSIDFSGPSGDGSISVLPLDAVAFYKVDRMRFGLGLAYYLNPKYEICFDGSGCDTYNFDDALGVVFEMRHQATDNLFWGARYTNVDYDIGADSVDASSLRIHLGMVF